MNHNKKMTAINKIILHHVHNIMCTLMVVNDMILIMSCSYYFFSSEIDQPGKPYLGSKQGPCLDSSYGDCMHCHKLRSMELKIDSVDSVRCIGNYQFYYFKT